MPAGRPEDYMKAPAEQDIDDAVEAGAAAVDEMIAMQTPSGRYTAPRLRAFSKSLEAALQLLQPGFKLDVDITPESLGQGKNPLASGNRKVQMPAKLVASYIALRQAEDAYLREGHDEEPAEGVVLSTLAEPITLVSDGAVALAARYIDILAGNKTFRRWAKKMQKTDASQLPARPPARPVSGSPPADTSQADADWNAMWAS